MGLALLVLRILDEELIELDEDCRCIFRKPMLLKCNGVTIEHIVFRGWESNHGICSLDLLRAFGDDGEF